MILSAKFYVKKLDLFLFLIFISNVLVSTSSTGNKGVKCIDREREALLKFKDDLIDDYGRLSTWGSEHQKKECCKWKGIRCHNKTNRIVSLDLHGPLDPGYAYPEKFKCLRGKISPFLSELSDITYLDLSNNDFNSTIPKLFGSYRKLQHLNLSHSGFFGSIQSHLGNLSMLKVLDLRGYRDILYAEDLDWISGLNSLQHLDLSGVNLRKVVTWLEPINKLTQLKKLYLSNCDVKETLFTASYPLVSNESANSLMLLDLSGNFQLEISTFLWFLNFSSNYRYIDFSANFPGVKILDALTNLMFLSHLGLFNGNLKGSIPVTLGNMTSLAYLDLSENNFEGNIPAGICKLMSISYLDLSRNNLRGGFPCSHGNLSNLISLRMSENKLEEDLTYMSDFLGASTMLEHLDLSDNRFYGPVPPLSRFPFLNTLNLGINQLNGSFVDTKLRLPYLTSLDVSENRLTGSLPDFASCLSLEHLGLQANKFNGALTETIGYLSKVPELDLSSNKLEGVISEAHLFNLSTLRSLDLSHNSNLTIKISSDWSPPFQLHVLNLANCTIGPRFPKWMQNQTRMEHLDISNSRICDLVPGWFWENSPTMRYLNMSFNHMYGVIPDSNLSTLFLDLRSNDFNGSLPLHSASGEIYLSRNKFSGEINEFCSAMNQMIDVTSDQELCGIDLSGNKLSGEITEECFMNLKTSRYVNLGNNNLSGEIPNTNSSYCALRSLHLRNNSFTGHIPVSIRDCDDLRMIDLGDNYFMGEIPKWFGESFSRVHLVSLRSNRLTGTLPSSLCFLKNIEILDISSNEISGTIPRCLNSFIIMSKQQAALEHLDVASNYLKYATAYIMWKGRFTEFTTTLWMVTVIDLSSNRLVGEIPTEITSLEGLISLNLSRNRLVGSIPRDIDKLKYLDILDLSENNLSGHIPITLSRLDQLGWMNLSCNNLSGKIPCSTHSETFSSNAFLGNPQLCGPPLSRPCQIVPHIPKPIIHSDSEDDVDTYITKGFYVSMAVGFILAFWGTFGTLNFNKTCRIKFSKLLMALDDWWYVKIALNKRKLQRYFQNQ